MSSGRRRSDHYSGAEADPPASASLPREELSLVAYREPTVETVTPLFLGGANRKATPALRGLLRYWLRASAGGVIGDQHFTVLHQLEAAVFRDTRRTEPVTVRLTEPPGELRHQHESILPHKSLPRRPPFSSGQRFDIRLVQALPGWPHALPVAASILQLALTLGGPGLRSRRGYGTLRIVASSDSALVPPFPTTLEGWKQHLEGVIAAAAAAVERLATSLALPIAGLPPHPTAFPCANRNGLLLIVRPKVGATALEALRSFMTKVPHDPAFGGIAPRQASPLWVHPIKADRSSYLLLTVLASHFISRLALHKEAGRTMSASLQLRGHSTPLPGPFRNRSRSQRRGEPMTEATPVFTFGPVQPFSANVRRASDLFVGSQVLACLAEAAARALGQAGADLVYPAAPKDGADRLLSELLESVCQVVCRTRHASRCEARHG